MVKKTRAGLTRKAICSTNAHVMNKRNKDGEIRARCDLALKKDVNQVAIFMGLDDSDIIRMACTAFVQKFRNQNANAQAQV